MQKRIYGVTQKFWKDWNPEYKLYWSFARPAFAWCLSIFIVTKTSNFWVDTFVTLITGAVPLLIVSGQRDYSNLPRLVRRRVTRYGVKITLIAVTALGLGVYLALIYGLYSGVVGALPVLAQSPMSHSLHALANLPNAPEMVFIQLINNMLISVVIVLASAAAGFNAFRGMQIEEMIYRAPKRGLIKYLVRRELKATDLPTFVAFELGVILASVMFSSTVVMAFQIVIEVPTGV